MCLFISQLPGQELQLQKQPEKKIVNIKTHKRKPPSSSISVIQIECSSHWQWLGAPLRIMVDNYSPPIDADRCRSVEASRFRRPRLTFAFGLREESEVWSLFVFFYGNRHYGDASKFDSPCNMQMSRHSLSNFANKTSSKEWMKRFRFWYKSFGNRHMLQPLVWKHFCQKRAARFQWLSGWLRCGRRRKFCKHFQFFFVNWQLLMGSSRGGIFCRSFWDRCKLLLLFTLVSFLFVWIFIDFCAQSVLEFAMTCSKKKPLFEIALLLTRWNFALPSSSRQTPAQVLFANKFKFFDNLSVRLNGWVNMK